MSLIPRIILAAVAALFGVVMIAIAPPTDKAVFFYGFGAFCLSIAVACISRGRVAEFFGSLVGLGVFGAALWYVGSMMFDGHLWSGRRSEPSLINALLFMGVFGLPGAIYVYHARFGLRGPERSKTKQTSQQTDEP